MSESSILTEETLSTKSFNRSDKSDSFCNSFYAIKERSFDGEMIKEFVKSNFDWNIIVNRFIKIIKK